MKGTGLTTLVLAVVAVILIGACGGSAPAPTATSIPTPTATVPPAANSGGDVDGQVVFRTGGCGACHAIEGIFSGVVGPDLTHIGTEAATRKPGVSARDYIVESIRLPEAFVPEGVERAIPGVMTATLSASLSDQDVDALVEFLLAQQ